MKQIHTPSDPKVITSLEENRLSTDTKWVVASVSQSTKETIEILEKPKQMIIAMIGPPNSGKSVFSVSFKLHIGRHLSYLIRACPDWEWDWRQMAQSDVANYCVEKSKLRMWDKLYDPALVEWYKQSIQNSTSIPFLMVDIGWKITEENKELLRLATHCIIICSEDKMNEKPDWIRCAQECWVPILAEIDTIKDWEEAIYGIKEMTFHGRSANLERRTIATGDTIITLAEQVKTMVDIPEMPEEVFAIKEKNGEIFEELNISKINEILNIQNKTRIQNGREISYPMWTQNDIYRFKEIIPSIAHSSDRRLHINGACPKFLQAYIASIFDGDISASDPKIPWWVVFIQRSQKESQDKNATNLSYGMKMDYKKAYILEIAVSTPDKIIHNLQEEIDNLSLQNIEIKDQNGKSINFLSFWKERADIWLPFEDRNAILEKGIVLSEKLPLPLTSKLVRELQKIAPFVAIHTPQQSQVENRDDESLAMIVTGPNAGNYISLPI
jgi:hypothetical protein